MFARNRTDFRRSWRRSTTTDLRFLSAGVTALADTTATIEFRFTSGCQGQLEYGATTAYGSTTTLETSYDYATHIQTITGLSAGATVHYRAKGIAPDATVVYSEDQTFTTTGAPTAETAGRRAKPAYPTGAYVVPGGTTGATLQAYIDSVPNGASITSKSVIVLNQTGGASTTTYTMSSGINLSGRSNLTLFGWDTKLVMTGSGSSSLQSGIYIGTAATGITIQGLEIEGGNTWAGTTLAYAKDGTKGEYSMGVAVYGASRYITIEDVWVHNVMGDGIYISGATPHFLGDMTVNHCLVELTGRQGVTYNVGDNLTLTWSIVEDVALSCLDGEDCRVITGTIDGLYVRNNEFRRWNWHYTGTVAGGYYRAHAIQFIYGVSGTYLLATLDNVYIEDNLFDDGAQGWPVPGTGDSASEDVFLSDGSRSTNATPKTGVYIRDNTWTDIPAVQAAAAEAILVNKVVGGAITGNATGGRVISLLNSSGVTNTGNT